MTTTPRLVILDTDPGVDDALALLYLRARLDLRPLAITTVFGNADVETTTRNARWLRQRLGLEAPVHRGAGAPLARPRGVSPVHVHGENGLGDIDLSGPVLPPPDTGAAHEKIVDLVRAHPDKVTIVAIGPLTNLALALRAAPDIAGLVAEIVIMGGAFARGNVTPFAEANIHNDPEAAAEVLAAPWPVTLVPLDATLPCVLTDATARDMAQTGETGRFVHDLTRGYAATYARHEGLDGCVLHDVAALVRITRPELFKVRSAPVSVILDGERLGQTVWSEQGPIRQVCVDADGPELARHFQQTLA
ncbi:nucleoside hydrolase [Caulobacter sp. FWC2]|uniref:nucleoside hydrolase n=1 Tax=Caulobacter sp. FWC2 TaxID=69664 RepID=UPI000C151A92|nr:nucleoside hydrolase [Caulobacter sp. FWC2]PIB93447.1 nucleoside hydrolase [Caulobacter sp. FWC2]